jgi:FixJ family two-component response regulator
MRTKGQWIAEELHLILHSMTSGASPKALYVAIVDDDDSMRRSLSKLLGAAGMNTCCFGSAEKFLECATLALVDCLVLDIHLGGLSGFDLQRYLATRGAVPPIIFMTAHDGSDTRQQAERACCAAYFTKPFSGRSMMTAIEQAVTAESRPGRL